MLTTVQNALYASAFGTGTASRSLNSVLEAHYGTGATQQSVLESAYSTDIPQGLDVPAASGGTLSLSDQLNAELLLNPEYQLFAGLEQPDLNGSLESVLSAALSVQAGSIDEVV